MTPQSHDAYHDHPPRKVKLVLAKIFQIEDTSTYALFRQIKTINHLLRVLFGEFRKDDFTPSHPRMRLLIRLEIDARLGRDDGVLPSELSQWLGVSRNTVSALLNGLEEQGLIQRHLHPEDRRRIQIRLTEEGHVLVNERAPKMGSFIHDLFDTLTLEERETLNALLEKLLEGMLVQAAEMGINVPDSMTPSKHTEP
ncbi:MAG: MarR family transcriptional regulator [Anaerolineae bacterium]|nr:MarR family transcriptional regulator [Anaerolineae bacterium]